MNPICKPWQSSQGWHAVVSVCGRKREKAERLEDALESLLGWLEHNRGRIKLDLETSNFNNNLKINDNQD